MADLYNDFPSWGETGEYPTSGFFYEGGDQVNEKHMDALWNGVKTHIDRLIGGIEDRVADISGDVVLDSGLVVTQGSNTREVDISASSEGAYVDGQFTGSTSATTLTLSTNGGSSTRTDSIWVDTQGQIGATEGTTSVGDDRHKIAEVDVATDDTISDVRNTARDATRHFSSEVYDSGQVPGGTRPGDLWHEKTTDRIDVRQGGGWQTLITEQDDVTLNAGDGLDGTETEDLVGGADFTFDVDVSDLLGAGVTEDGSNNLVLDESVIKDGGAKEIDAQEFAGGDGSNGQILTTDGSNASWSTPPSASVSEDGSTVVALPDDINFGEELVASDDGDNTVTVNSTALEMQFVMGQYVGGN